MRENPLALPPPTVAYVKPRGASRNIDFVKVTPKQRICTGSFQNACQRGPRGGRGDEGGYQAV